MSQPLTRPMDVAAFFAWQERQDERYELVGGVPVRMMAGSSNRHDDVVANLFLALGNRIRGGSCRMFTSDGAVETFPGQIRRPDLGIDCGKRDPNAFKAAEPKLVVEVLSPSTRDFDRISKLGEYQSVTTVAHIVYVEPLRPDVTVWSRDPDGDWAKTCYESLDEAVPLAGLGIELPLAEIYDGVTFPAGPRLAFSPEA